jgi:hypothetical protein
MAHIEHFLFFPVVVLLAIILIALSFRLLFRLIAYFFVVLLLWYLIFLAGFAPSPYQVIKSYRPAPKTTTRVV